MIQAKGLVCVFQLIRRNIADCYLGSLGFGCDRGQHANRASADDQPLFARLDICPLHAVVADAERLDQRQHLGVQPLAVVNALDRHGDVLCERALALYAHRLIVCAGIDQASLARITCPAVEIRITGYDHARLKPFLVFVDLHDLRRKLVSRYARIRYICIRTPIGTEVASADTPVQKLEQRFPRLPYRFLNFLEDNFPWLFYADCFHL